MVENRALQLGACVFYVLIHFLGFLIEIQSIKRQVAGWMATHPSHDQEPAAAAKALCVCRQILVQVTNGRLVLVTTSTTLLACGRFVTKVADGGLSNSFRLQCRC